MNKPIFFLHITKTGGQTIEELLRRNYSKVFQFGHDEDYKSLPQEYDVYMGQTAPYTRDLIEGDVFSFAFVRDPIERLVSFYNYYKVHKFKRVRWIHADGTHEEYPIDSQLPLMDFFSQEPIMKVCMNRMTRDFGAEEPLFEPKTINATYKRALKNIDSYDFIGIFEQFNESLSKLGKILGKEFENIHINKVKKEKESVTSDEYRYLENYTMYDRKIYTYCLEKFNR
jgi:hypothetical protein